MGTQPTITPLIRNPPQRSQIIRGGVLIRGGGDYVYIYIYIYIYRERERYTHTLCTYVILCCVFVLVGAPIVVTSVQLA